METNNKRFSLDYTLVIKGIAALLLLTHHMIWKEVNIPINITDSSFSEMLVPITKTCVALFTILSGYGIYESSKKWTGNVTGFIIKHEKKLLTGFWWIYFPCLLLSFFLHINGTPIDIYGKNYKGIIFFILDGVGLKNLFNTPTLNQTWWYMETIIFLYLIFPVLKKMLKSSAALVCAVSFLIVVVYNMYDFIGYEREIIYIFPFVVGMIMSEKNVCNILVNKERKIKTVIYIGFSLILGIMACLFIEVIGNTLLAVVIIGATIEIGKYIDIMKFRVLHLLGVHSMNIFLLHSFLYYYFIGFRKVVSIAGNRIVGILILVVMSLGISLIIEKIKRSFKTRLIVKFDTK